MTREGKLIHVSENVLEYLGYSMVDVLQGDTFYDMVDSADVQVVRSHLEAASIRRTERAFVCRMHTSKPFRLRQDGSGCSMLVRGRFQTTPKSSQAPSDLRQTFIALCTPTVDRLHDGDAHSMLGHFESVHWLDMTFRRMSDSVLFHLGYPEEELIGQSWYGLLHPDDLSIGEAAHRRLQQEDKGVTVEMVLRLQHKDLSWVWLYVRAARDSGTCRQEVSCTNYVISEVEASFLRQKTSAAVPGVLSRSPPDLPLSLGSTSPPGRGEGGSRCSKRQREAAGLGEEPWAKRGAVPFTEHTNHTWDTNAPTSLRDFPTTPPISPNSAHSTTTPPISPDSTHSPTTPPISPDSAHSPILTESQSTDFLCSYAEDFLPPQGSSHHFSPPQLLQMVSDTPFCPSSLDVACSQSPESCYDFPACSTNARLVPDFLSETTSDMAFHPEDFSLPAYPPEHPPGGASPFLPVHSTALLTPDPSPTTESPFLYSQEEQVEIGILAQQISSLANSFRMYHSQSPAHSLNPALSPTLTPALSPTLTPALNPTLSPTLTPALSPTLNPVLCPTLNPSLNLTLNPALNPTFNPALSPTLNPSLSLALNPAHILNPTISPALSSTLNLALSPTPIPALSPTLSPTLSPILSPTLSLPSAYSKASSPSPPSQQTSLKPELILDEDVIDCILKHLDQVPGREATPYSRPTSTCPLGPPCVLEVLEAQGPVVFITAQEDKLLTPPTLDPCTLTSGCHGNSNELYQLSQYPCSSLQQGN
ncbi:neuronal PAS domain-containing protein 4-like [Anguilla rostrata]|uniref:neuronal PAS domain-containing protein 4-like n=1 Tax=Anguilla rostrata TaxID=7938 RepID=UPI0030CF512A